MYICVSMRGGRGVLTLSMFLAYLAVYSQRSHLGVTLIAMLNSTFAVHHQYHQPLKQHDDAADANLTRRRADCKPFPRRDNYVRVNTEFLIIVQPFFVCLLRRVFHEFALMRSSVESKRR